MVYHLYSLHWREKEIRVKEQWLYSEREDSLFRRGNLTKKANLATAAGNMIGLFTKDSVFSTLVCGQSHSGLMVGRDPCKMKVFH